MTSVHTLSIYLLKESVSTPRDSLRPDLDDLVEHLFTAPETEGVLCVAPAHTREPDWVALLRPATPPPVAAQLQTVSALLVLTAAGRWFAVAFGHRRTLIDAARYDRRFGLKVALNGVEPTLLRRAQACTFNDHSLHTHRQISKLSRVEVLELDAERDLVVAIGGTLADPQIGRQIDGRHAARLTAELDATTVAAKCELLLAKSKEITYRAEFPWGDTIEEVADPTEVADLEQRAGDVLGRRNFSGFDLYPPELVTCRGLTRGRPEKRNGRGVISRGRLL